MLSQLLKRYHLMFEIEAKKSGRLSHGSRNNSTSRSKLTKKEQLKPMQKIVLDVIKTDGYRKENSSDLKSKKSKSQCIPSQSHQGRKSIDVSKFIKTTRSIGSKKSKEKREKLGKIQQQLLTENKSRHQNLFISNLPTEKSTELKWAKKTSIKKMTEGRSAEKKKMTWNEKHAPMDTNQVLEHYSHYLTKYERSQIKQYKKIYYLGHKAAKKQPIDASCSKVFDNQQQLECQYRKQYVFVENDHIAYRYQILSLIGKGSYGQVLKVYDHKYKEEVALKIIKSDPKYSKQAFVEIKILSHIKEIDHDQQSNIVRIKDFVIFRKHVCIIFELLSDNLYELIIRNNYNGLSQQLIRRFAIQILVSLQFLKSNRIIHCDLKPENILLKEYNKSGIKIIDFGSSCFEKETIYTYIQSRYYRAPQITLGIPYDHKIDVWSTGCILAEMYLGVPVFPGQNQEEQMKYMTDTLGVPPFTFVSRGERRKIFFDEAGRVKPEIQSLKTTMDMFSKPLKDRIQDQDFLSFINAFLQWDPNNRIDSIEALNHPWISKGLPEELKHKLSYSNQELVKNRPRRESTSKLKGKSKQKSNSTCKLAGRSSQERLKKNYLLKY